MTTPLDKLLAQAGDAKSSSPDALSSLLQQELSKKPAPSWKAQWGYTVASSLLLVGVSAALLLLSGNITWNWVWNRLPSLMLLAGTGGFCAWAALAPRAQKLRPWSLGLWLLAMVGLVFLRGHDEPAAVTPWFCTLGHVGIGIIPLWVALGALRNSAPGKLRWILAGVFVGTTGAMSGELGCVGGLTHVAIYHLSAWWAMALVALILSLVLRTKSYAP